LARHNLQRIFLVIVMWKVLDAHKWPRLSDYQPKSCINFG
jgi:hypothetical protein